MIFCLPDGPLTENTSLWVSPCEQRLGAFNKKLVKESKNPITLYYKIMLLQIPYSISSRIDYSCPIECPVSWAQLVENPNVKQLRARGIPQDFHRIKRLTKNDLFVYLKPNRKTSPFRADPPV